MPGPYRVGRQPGLSTIRRLWERNMLLVLCTTSSMTPPPPPEPPTLPPPHLPSPHTTHTPFLMYAHFRCFRRGAISPPTPTTAHFDTGPLAVVVYSRCGPDGEEMVY